MAKGKTAYRGIEMAQRSRAAVLNALDVVESRGRLISEILADEFESNPLKFMELAAKLTPKEISGEINHVHTAQSLTDDALADIATGGSTRAVNPAQSKTELH